jgi:YHS domain-containing protein
MYVNKNYKTTIRAMLVIVAAVFFISGIPAGAAPGAEKKVKAQTICPVMGDPINKKFFVDYKGYRIYFCCSSCPEEFMKNPEKYMKKLRESGVTLEKAPGKGAKKEDAGRHDHHHVN